MEEERHVTELRARLTEYFNENARQRDIKIVPTERSQHDMVLAGRLFEEEKGARLYFVSYHSDRQLDAFIKKAGRSRELDLLQIFTNGDEEDLARLWLAYVAWLHEEGDGRAILTFLNAVWE